ncbi:hypothetical protein AAHA92_31551 [Salvia divinorum]|uniref:Uncharacterized protein n=1 Tax=Salvia divinorum TaxID=28513 RepID=A0ABD1FHS2_SALDI
MEDVDESLSTQVKMNLKNKKYNIRSRHLASRLRPLYAVASSRLLLPPVQPSPTSRFTAVTGGLPVVCRLGSAADPGVPVLHSLGAVSAARHPAGSRIGRVCTAVKVATVVHYTRRADIDPPRNSPIPSPPIES